MNVWLLAAGAASAIAAIAHLLCIVNGAAWYQAMGAGERMVRAVAAGRVAPHLVTVGIAATLAICAAYAWSGAGLLPRLPLVTPVLFVVTGIYLLRAAALPLLFTAMPDRRPAFLIWSSIIVLLIGMLHLAGFVQRRAMCTSEIASSNCSG